jgi:hypothetical protein
MSIGKAPANRELENTHTIHNVSIDAPNRLLNLALSRENIGISPVTVEEISTGTTYIDCQFNHLHFCQTQMRDVKFQGCTFQNCLFEQCISFTYQEFDHCDFINCRLEGYTFASRVLFNHCFFNGVLFWNSLLYNAVFYTCCFVKVTFRDRCNLSATWFLHPAGCFDISFDGETATPELGSRFRLSDFSYGDHSFKDRIKKIYFIEEQPIVLTRNGYLGVEGQLIKNLVPLHYSNCFYFRNKVETRSGGWMRKISRIVLFEWSCGYGEKPWYALALSGILILLFSVAYFFAGFADGQSTIRYGIDLSHGVLLDPQILSDFGRSLYFSLITFLTVGIGSIKPATTISEFIFCVELLCGAILIVLFTGSLMRMMTR